MKRKPAQVGGKRRKVRAIEEGIYTRERQRDRDREKDRETEG